jgi:hypothetical protein
MSIIRRGSMLRSSGLLLAGLFALAATRGFSSSLSPETIRAAYTQDGSVVSVTLVIYDYTTPLEKQILSQAFEEGHDQGLVAALSKSKAAGLCSIAGNLSFDVAFIQMVVTPTGRQITFITSRPLQSDEVDRDSESRSFDLMVGEFDMNDTDNGKSTGFLYPAARLVIDQQGEFHYDLAGNPWSLASVLDSNWTPALAEREAPEAAGAPAQSLP